MIVKWKEAEKVFKPVESVGGRVVGFTPEGRRYIGTLLHNGDVALEPEFEKFFVPAQPDPAPDSGGK